MQCKKCGNPLLPDNVFCAMCGEKVEIPKPKKRKKHGWLIFVAVFMVCISITIYYVDTHGPDDTVEALEDAINAMDLNAMAECMDDKAAMQVKGAAMLSEGVASYASDALGVDIDMIANFFFGMSAVSGKGLLVECETLDVQYYENYTKCDVQVKITVSIDGQRDTTTEVWPMILDDGKWVLNASEMTDTLIY